MNYNNKDLIDPCDNTYWQALLDFQTRSHSNSVKPIAPLNGPTYPHSHRVYFNLLIKRIALKKKLLELNAPACIQVVQNKIIFEAALGTIFPSVVNICRRQQHQTFLNSLCAKQNGWSFCKRQANHDDYCEYDWNKAADLMETEKR